MHLCLEVLPILPFIMKSVNSLGFGSALHMHQMKLFYPGICSNLKSSTDILLRLSYICSLARIKEVEEISPQHYNITLDLQNRVQFIDGLCPRYSNWFDLKLGCDGKFVKTICHISLQDLKVHLKRNQLGNGDQHCYVINKVDVEVDTRPIHYLAQQLSSFVVDNQFKTYKPFV